MKIDYNKKTKTMEIVPLDELEVLSSPVLLLNDIEVLNLEEGSSYEFSKDDYYKVEVSHVVGDELVIDELGYILVVEFSKDKNRVLLIEALDEVKMDILSPLYVKNRRLITEIEHSFSVGNLRRIDLLFKELSWL